MYIIHIIDKKLINIKNFKIMLILKDYVFRLNIYLIVNVND